MTRDDNKMKPLMVARKTYAFPNNVLNIESANLQKEEMNTIRTTLYTSSSKKCGKRR